MLHTRLSALSLNQVDGCCWRQGESSALRLNLVIHVIHRFLSEKPKMLGTRHTKRPDGRTRPTARRILQSISEMAPPRSLPRLLCSFFRFAAEIPLAAGGE